MKSTYGFDLNAKLDKAESSSPISGFGSMTQRSENTTKRLDNHKISRNLTNPLESPEQLFTSPYPKGNMILKFLFSISGFMVRLRTYFF